MEEKGVERVIGGTERRGRDLEKEGVGGRRGQRNGGRGGQRDKGGEGGKDRGRAGHTKVKSNIGRWRERQRDGERETDTERDRETESLSVR